MVVDDDGSILNNTKKLCGLPVEDTSFDLDILLHINSAFSTLNDLGIGPSDGFEIVGDDTTWADFLGINAKRYSSVKSYIYLKVRMLWDPPATSFLLQAQEKMVTEFEWRLNVRRELLEWVDPMGDVSEDDELVLDGGAP